MKVVLLGKNGLLGSEIATILQNTQGLQLAAFSRAQLDITDSKSLENIINEIQADFVINAAGYTNVDKAEEESELAMKINGYAVGGLAKICYAKKIPIMHFGTDYVFSGTASEVKQPSNFKGYPENSLPHPINAYGESKELGEKLLIKNTPYFFLIRSQWLFGKNGKNFVKSILENAKTKPVLRVVNDQFGKPTYAKDLAKAIIPFFDSDKYGIYHIVNEGVTSWFDYAVEILKIAGIQKEVTPISSKELDRKAKRPKYSPLINMKLPQLRHWKEALKDYLFSELLLDERYHPRRRTRDTTLPIVKSDE